jgi:hypothetical protein
MTRWNNKDLTGALIRAQKETKSDQWEVIEFPAIYAKMVILFGQSIGS